MVEKKLIFDFLKTQWKPIFLYAYFLLLLPVFLATKEEQEPDHRCVYVICLMAAYWMLEILPPYVIALIPLAFFPSMEIPDTGLIAKSYSVEPIMTMITGLMVALAIECSDLHTWFALLFIKMIGPNFRILNLVLVIITVILSLLIANTAAACVMLPITQALLSELESEELLKTYEEGEDKRPTNVTKCFHLSIAYAATVGGLGFVTSSPTNTFLRDKYEILFVPPDSKDKKGVEFEYWAAMGLVMVLVIIVPVWLWMQVWFMGLFRPNSADARALAVEPEQRQTAKLTAASKLEGRGKCQPITVLVFLVILLLSWILMPVWAVNVSYFKIYETTPAALVLFWLFAIPFGQRVIEKRWKTLLMLEYVQKNMLWTWVLVMGGGMALAFGIFSSGLNFWILRDLTNLDETKGSTDSSLLDPYPLVIVLSLITTILTQFVPNLGAANVFVPLSMTISTMLSGEKVYHPIFMSMPVCMACSLSFLLPMSTPPNAIMAASCNMRTLDVMKVGGPILLWSFLMLIAIVPNFVGLFWEIDKL